MILLPDSNVSLKHGLDLPLSSGFSVQHNVASDLTIEIVSGTVYVTDT